MKNLILIFILLTMSFISCKKNSNSTNFTTDCSGAAKSYKNDVQPIIQNYCVGCHSNYLSYSQVYSSRDEINNTVGNGIMPRNGSLTSAQKNAIMCWINNGALNN